MHIRFNNSSRSENKIKQLPFFVCPTFDKHFGFTSVSISYMYQKIQCHENRTFLFCLSTVWLDLKSRILYLKYS